MQPEFLSKHSSRSSIRKVFSEWEEYYSKTDSLSSNASDNFACKSSVLKTGCFCAAHKNSSCWATTCNSISTREILDTKNEILGRNRHSSELDLQLIQGTSKKISHWRAIINTSTSFEDIPHYGADYAGPISFKLRPPRIKTIKKSFKLLYLSVS